MLSITAFTLLRGFARKSGMYARNWLSAVVCQPRPALGVQPQNHHSTTYAARQADTTAMGLLFKCSPFVVVINVYEDEQSL